MNHLAPFIALCLFLLRKDEEASRENAIFCLMCRVMVGRAFEWTGLQGDVIQVSSRAESGESCRFDITLRDGPNKTPERPGDSAVHGPA